MSVTLTLFAVDVDQQDKNCRCFVVKTMLTNVSKNRGVTRRNRSMRGKDQGVSK